MKRIMVKGKKVGTIAALLSSVGVGTDGRTMAIGCDEDGRMLNRRRFSYKY